MTKPELTHYTIAFVLDNGKIRVHDDWLPSADIKTNDGLNEVKLKLLHSYFCANEAESAEFLDVKDAKVGIAHANPNETQTARDVRPFVEPASNVVINKVICRWDVANESIEALPNEPKYDLKIRSTDSQAFIDISPEGINTIEALEGLPQLSLLIEVNQGLPCVHVYSDLHGEVVQTLFAGHDSKLIMRPGEAQRNSEIVSENFAPEAATTADSLEAVIIARKQTREKTSE